MDVFVNGKIAAIKRDSSFEYHSENRLFTGSDGYTLNITFPLMDCPRNRAIFGHINRADVDMGTVVFDCEIVNRDVCLVGSLAIIKITEKEVEAQFLEGRSAQNYDITFDDIYINELELGDGTDCASLAPTQAWTPSSSSNKCVALPWINDQTGDPQNIAYYNSTSKSYSWSEQTTESGHTGGPGGRRPSTSSYTIRSWQPYLLYITKAICAAIGYDCDFSEWEANPKYKYLLICNTLPSAWDIVGFARALPHWTVNEYFDKLELFLGAEFDFNHRTKSISFKFSDNIINGIAPVALDEIVDEHTISIDVENEDCDYRGAKNIVYKECDHDMWKFYSCDWFLRTWDYVVRRYSTLTELIYQNKNLYKWNSSEHRPGDPAISNRSYLLYAEDVDAYFVVRCLSAENTQSNGINYTMELRPINLLGGNIVNNNKDADELEIEFVPVRIDATDETYGRMMFLSFASFGEEDDFTSDEDAYQTYSVKLLSAGEKDETAEYYSCIYLAWWDGTLLPTNGMLPHPHVERLEIADDWSSYKVFNLPFPLNYTSGNLRGCTNKINPKKVYSFSFISDKIPNVRAVFHIKGHQYLCKKITATFTENGMSQLLKGEFYPLADD